MNISPMDLLCTITSADQKLSPLGDPSIDISYDCSLSKFSTKSFCTNPDLFYLADEPKPVEKMLALIPTNTKPNKPDDGVFYNYYWNVVKEVAVTAQPAAQTPWAPAAKPVQAAEGSAPAAEPSKANGNTDATWWSWGDRLRTDADIQRDRKVSIEHQSALKEARLATDFLLTWRRQSGNEPEGETDPVDDYIATLGRIYQGMVDLLMS